MINFGTGKMIAVPTADANGNAIAVPTPVVLGILQDISVDMSVDLVRLMGEKRFAEDVAQGKGKIEIKAKYADIDAGVIGSLFYGKSPTAGIKAAVLDAASAIPTTPFQITVVPPSSGTYVANLGVTINGVTATRVASAPQVGQYTQAAAVYTFNTADVGKTARISYEYSAATGGQVFTITNDVMGPSPSFSMLLQNTSKGRTMVLKLENCVSGKLNVPFKNDSHGIYDFEAEAFNGPTGVGYICLI
jgi:hypothetical protein